jgi:uncharacterized protein (TIGR02246 family)
MTDPRTDVVHRLFAAWSSGDADAPKQFFHADAVLHDIVGGEHRGWPAIRTFFAAGLRKWPDLVLAPEQFWTSDDGVALTWVMSATITEPMAAHFGDENVGRKWRSDGMSWLRFVDGRIAYEMDYHDSGAIARSLA